MKKGIETARYFDPEITVLLVTSNTVLRDELAFRELVEAVSRVHGNLVLDLTPVRVADAATLGELVISRVRLLKAGYEMALVSPKALTGIFPMPILAAAFMVAENEAVARDMIHAACAPVEAPAPYA